MKSNDSHVNFYIYKITLNSNKTYIGQRKYYCEYGLNALSDKYCGSSCYMKRNPDDKIINKEILIENVKNQETLDFLETWCILSEIAYNKENNVNGNYGGFIHKCRRLKGCKVSDEERIKMKIRTSNLWKNKEFREKCINSHKGKKQSKETIEKRIKNTIKKHGYWGSKKGRISPMKGKHLSEDAKRRISEKHKGKKLSKETIEKMRKSRLGKCYFSDEKRKEISERMKGNKLWLGRHHSKESIEKMKNRKISQETRIKISTSLCGHKNWAKEHTDSSKLQQKITTKLMYLMYKDYVNKNLFSNKFNDFQKI